MQSSAWIELLRLLPTTIHNKLSIITQIGQEMAVQNIFRIDPEFLVFRGRLLGTSDEGRVYILPYAEMHGIGFQKQLKEHEVDAILSGRDPYQTAEQLAMEAADLEPAQPLAAETPPEIATTVRAPTPPPAPVPAKAKSKHASRVLLLERVRARLAAANQLRPPGAS
jgi:hypothetical protein